MTNGMWHPRQLQDPVRSLFHLLPLLLLRHIFERQEWSFHGTWNVSSVLPLALKSLAVGLHYCTWLANVHQVRSISQHFCPKRKHQWQHCTSKDMHQQSFLTMHQNCEIFSAQAQCATKATFDPALVCPKMPLQCACVKKNVHWDLEFHWARPQQNFSWFILKWCPISLTFSVTRLNTCENFFFATLNHICMILLFVNPALFHCCAFCCTFFQMSQTIPQMQAIQAFDIWNDEVCLVTCLCYSNSPSPKACIP